MITAIPILSLRCVSCHSTYACTYCLLQKYLFFQLLLSFLPSFIVSLWNLKFVLLFIILVYAFYPVFISAPVQLKDEFSCFFILVQLDSHFSCFSCSLLQFRCHHHLTPEVYGWFCCIRDIWDLVFWDFRKFSCW